MILSINILSLIICILAAAFGIRRRFSFPLFLLVIAHPVFWLEGSEAHLKSSVLFALCSLCLVVIPQLLPSGTTEEHSEKRF